MKRRLFTFALAALTIGLLGSCSKINERIDGLDKRVYDLENEKIASIENQIAAINQSIADLETIRTNIQNLKNAQEAQGQDITDLQAEDQALEGKINDLRTYVDTELSQYATTEWAKAAFATLENLNETNTALGALEEKVKKLGETFDGKLADLTELTNSINTAVRNLETRISALEARVSALEAMIQSVSITPAYSDGSVEAVDGILTLKCIVSPAEALIGMESLKDSLLIYADSVKVKTKATTPAYMTIEVSEASVLDAAQGAITLKADISKYLPKGEDKALTVAVNIKNGISDFTTEFVPVYVYVAPEPVAPEGFVYLGVKDANGKPLFWAECNLGASNPQDYGDYFAWGETAPYYTTIGGWPATPAWKSGKDSGYAWGSYSGQSSFKEWDPAPYDDTKILKPEFDAATAANSSWRTPTKDEFVALAAGCVWWWTADYNSTGKAGYIVYKAKNEEDKGKANMNGTWKKWNSSTNSYDTGSAITERTYSVSIDGHIFFPATGYGNGKELRNLASTGIYWSSSLYTDAGAINNAYRLNFTSGDVKPQSSSGRCLGSSVRPVTIESSDPKPVVPVTGVTLDKTELSLKVGNSETLKATVQPADATNQNVIWSSDNTGVATVGSTDGKVTAVAEGTATITAIVDGLYTATCTVTVNASSEPEYVVMKMGTGEGAYTLKWATKNLGATTVAGSYTTCYGDLYQWGSVNTLYDGFPWTSATAGDFTNKWRTGKTSGFVDANREYTGTDATLPDANDVVKQTIGGGWRMPTTEEFQALYDACLNGSYNTKTNPSGASASVDKGVYWCTSYDGVKGLLFCDGTNKLFFPATGYGDGTSLSNAGSYGRYWSSSLFTTANFAYSLYFSSVSAKPQVSNYRYLGFPVRPVKDAAKPLPAGALKGEFSVSADKKVLFSQGNLVATIDDSGAPTAWKFAANQYDYLGVGGANKKIGTAAGDVDLFGWSTASTTYGISKSQTPGDYSGDFVDWGKNIGDGNTWRTLSKDEWTYLFNTRTVNSGTGAGKSYSLNITYGGKMGVVLYPDDYTGSVLSGTVDSLPEGVVFLPAAGFRNGSNVLYAGTNGSYWSSTAGNSNNVYDVNFNSSNVAPATDGLRFIGFSVRLVTEVK